MTLSTYLSCYPAASVPSVNNCAGPMAELSKWDWISVMNSVGFHTVRSRHWHNHPGLLAPRGRPVAELFVNQGTDSSAFSTRTWLFSLEQKVDWKDLQRFHETLKIPKPDQRYSAQTAAVAAAVRWQTCSGAFTSITGIFSSWQWEYFTVCQENLIGYSLRL